ncbi:uncharacterized protein [Prorops nasuta]|uniref:uncharacterized protein n=1 Tax=Prorops nasuta TaxID=863751 RepID=UPI0034CDB94F
MAIPFALPSEDETDTQTQQLEQLMLDLYAALQQVLRSRTSQYSSRNHRVPRRSGDGLGSREHPVVLLDQDLARLPLPDLVLSAVEQLPASPQVTVSAPSSPTRDAAFQFPEYSDLTVGGGGTMRETELIDTDLGTVTQDGPVPSPRPRPRRRRLTSEGASTEKHRQLRCTGISCCAHHRLNQALRQSQWANVGDNLRNIADDLQACKTKDAELEKPRLPLLGSGFTSANSNSTSSTDGILSSLIPAPLRETLWTTVAIYLGWRLVSHLR